MNYNKLIHYIKNISSIHLLALVFATFILYFNSSHTNLNNYSLNAIDYSSNNKIGNASVIPVNLKSLRHIKQVNELKIDLNFTAELNSFSYGNLFQTGSTDNAIRMELQPPNKLVVVIGGQVVTVSDFVQEDIEHKLTLNYKKNNFFRVFLNNNLSLDVEDKSTINNDYDLSDIVVGAGLGSKRKFLGEISKFELIANVTQLTLITTVCRMLFIFFSGIIFLYIVSKFHFKNKNRIDPNRKELDFFVLCSSIFVLIGFCLSLSVLAYLYFKSFSGYSKWLPFLLTPFYLFFIVYLLNRNKIRLTKYNLLLIYPAFIYLFFGVFYTLVYKPHTFGYELILMILFPLTAYYFSFLNSIKNIARKNYFVIAGASFYILTAISCWFYLFDLTNWMAFQRLLSSDFSFTVLGFFTILVLIFYFLSETFSCSSIRFNLRHHLLSAFNILVIFVFLYLSFRHDSLFIPGSEYHWEYFIGVIKTIRNGGTLLWDTPSQYGFLNILIPALLPIKSSWQSFYIFQGSLLFIVATTLFFVLSNIINLNFPSRFIVFMFIVFSLFFADPAIIGPYPYPSSSVIRFFWIYIFIALAILLPKPGLLQTILFSCVFVLSSLWSAESFIYTLAISFFVFLTLVYLSFITSKSILKPIIFITKILTFIVTIFVLLFFVYKFLFGVYPDLINFIEYGLGYAGGFGFVLFPLNGPGNFLLLLFVVIFFNYSNILIKNKSHSNDSILALSVLLGSLWAISTYYIGRPVPQNITALLPIITTIILVFFLILSKENFQPQEKQLNFVRALIIPFLFIVLAPICNINFWYKINDLETLSYNISSKLRKADSSLMDLIRFTNIKPDTPIIYYGDDAAPPIFSNKVAMNESNWLPVPLQLLENPINGKRRSVYLSRFICGNKIANGALIIRNNPTINPRASIFIKELKMYYGINNYVKNNEYHIYEFSNLNLGSCGFND